MVNITISYEGDLHTNCTHGPSGTSISTDAPVDNEGRGESFSPTDLVATALASCIATIMGIQARKHDIDISGMKMHVTKEMSADRPRRISKITAQFEIPLPENHPKRPLLESAATTCPVHHSLHPDVEREITFKWVG